jgi:hypothetical protein
MILEVRAESAATDRHMLKTAVTCDHFYHAIRPL